MIFMTDLIRRDPFLGRWVMPSWMSDLDDILPQSMRRGLRVKETESDIIVEAVVAGVPEKEVEVHIEDGVLTIKAQKKVEEERESYEYSYYYNTALSGGQWDKAEAEVEHGVVTIIIPKAEAAKPRQVTVKTKTKSK